MRILADYQGLKPMAIDLRPLGPGTIPAATEFRSMILSHQEPADGDGENTCKFLEPKLDPFSAVDGPFAEQEQRVARSG